MMFGHIMGLKDREAVKVFAQIDDFVGPNDTLSHSSASNSIAEVKDAEHQKARTRGSNYDFNAVNGSGDGLKQALQEAILSHRQCARANEEVARQYERLLSRS